MKDEVQAILVEAICLNVHFEYATDDLYHSESLSQELTPEITSLIRHAFRHCYPNDEFAAYSINVSFVARNVMDNFNKGRAHRLML